MAAAGAALLTAEDRQELLTTLTEMKTAYKKCDDDIGKLGKADSDTLVRVDKLTDDMISIHRKHADDAVKRIDALELRINENRHGVQAKSFGERVVEDTGLVNFVREGKQGSYGVALPGWRGDSGQKNILDLSPLMPQALAMIAALPQMPFGVRSLVPQGRTTAGAIEYMRELTFTNSAAPVAEGAVKPQSDKTFDIVSAVVRTIAHYFKVSRQSFEDLPALAAFIENNGIYGIEIKEDGQFLNGDGIAPNLQGFMTVAATAPAGVVGGSLVDVVGAAMFDLASKGYLPDGVVVNPADWGAVAMLKNSQGNYLFANPMDYSAAPRLWGARFVTSANMAAGSFLVGQFNGKSQILDREAVNAQVATQNEDDFVRNMYTVRVEERTVLLIFDAKAFEKGVIPAPVVGGTEAIPERRPR